MKTKIKTLIISALLAIALASCGGGGGGSSKPAPKGCTVELIGDSVLNGFMLEETPKEYIQRKYPSVKIIDKAEDGQTMNAFTKSYDYTSKPDVVIFELGGNDVFNEEDYNSFESNLNGFIVENLNRNKNLVFTSVVRIDGATPPFWTDEIKNRVSTINNIVLKHSYYYNIDNARWDTVEYKLEDTLDGVHRKQEASNYLTSLLFPYIEKYCKF